MKEWKGMVYQDGVAYTESNDEIYEKKLCKIAYILDGLTATRTIKKSLHE